MALAKKGYHILLEKPMAVSYMVNLFIEHVVLSVVQSTDSVSL